MGLCCPSFKTMIFRIFCFSLFLCEFVTVWIWKICSDKKLFFLFTGIQFSEFLVFVPFWNPFNSFCLLWSGSTKVTFDVDAEITRNLLSLLFRTEKFYWDVGKFHWSVFERENFFLGEFIWSASSMLVFAILRFLLVDFIWLAIAMNGMELIVISIFGCRIEYFIVRWWLFLY
jgi:hypothetical protein